MTTRQPRLLVSRIGARVAPRLPVARALERIKVAVAGEHAVVRRGVASLLSETDDIRVVAEARNVREVLARLRSGGVELLVVDLGMPGADGFDLLEIIRRERHGVPVLALGVHADTGYAVRALRSGARGYIGSDASEEDLADAVRRVRSGGRWIPCRIAEHLAARLDDRVDRPAHELLSNREYDVLRRIGAGHSVKEIGRALHLSVKTVSTYRRRLLGKLGLRTTAQLIRYAVEHGLGEPPSRYP